MRLTIHNKVQKTCKISGTGNNEKLADKVLIILKMSLLDKRCE